MAPSGQPPADAADARTFEPRPASERALRGLTTWLAGPIETAVIAGAPGAGTTFVLRRFEAQERERRAVLFSPFLHMEAEGLDAWLDGLARTAGFVSLDTWLARAPTAPLLLVDEAHDALPAAIEALARLRASRAPKLRLCLGGCAGPALERATRQLGGGGLLVLELPPWSTDDLRRFAQALCTVAPADPAALVAGAEGSPGLLRLAWAELRERPPVRASEAPRPTRAVLEPAPAAPRAPRAEPPPIAAAPPRRAPLVELPPAAPTPLPAPSQPLPIAPAAPPPAPLVAPERAAAAAPSPAPELEATAGAGPALEPPPAAPPPRAPLAVRAPAATAAPPARRRARVPWFHAAALAVGFLLGLAGGWGGWDDPAPVREPVPEAPALEPVSAPPPVVPVAAPVRHDVQVNARPWAWIRIDGQAVGVTPLVQRGLVAGSHEFEATFPDGRQQRRTVEIGPDSRFVSFAD
jgi:hypothetical protein